jgi:hypothetical protein
VANQGVWLFRGGKRVVCCLRKAVACETWQIVVVLSITSDDGGNDCALAASHNLRIQP